MKYCLTLVFLLAGLGVSLALPQSTATKKPAAKKTTSASKTGSSKTAASKKGKAGKTAKTAPVAARQSQPTPERYKQIQQALVDKGYLKSEPNGVWDADSSAALAQFQADRKMTPTGKLTSASLIGLGLGPSTAPAAPQPASAADAAPHTGSELR